MTDAPTFPSGWKITVRTDGGRAYRLFRKAGQRWRCWMCDESVTRPYLERHRAIEIVRVGSEDWLAKALAIRALRRRKDRWRNRTQYYHEKALNESGIELK